jgi:heptosyltransferase-1
MDEREMVTDRRSQTPKHFLISRLSSLGDVVCSLPAAGALKAAYPDSHVTWVVDSRFSGIVRSCRFVDEVIEARPTINASSWPSFEIEFDAALDLQGLLKSAIPVGRAKSKVKLGYYWQREGAWLFSRPIIPDPSSWHIVDQYVDVARAAGGQANTAEFGLAPDVEDVEKVRDVLPDRFVVINAGAGWATKRWPGSYFGFVIDALAERGVSSVLIGSKGAADREAADVVLAATKAKPADFLGKTSVGELIALISLSRAHLGGDTGSTHIAAALGIPAVGLYSITRPKRSCPYGQVERCHYNPAGLSQIPPQGVTETLLSAVVK